MLSSLIFIPIAGTVLTLALPAERRQAFRWLAVGCTSAQLAVASYLWAVYVPTAGLTDESAFRFVERLEWMTLDFGSAGRMTVHYYLGVDGLSMPLLWLTGLVMLLAAISSFEIDHKPKGYFALFLLLSGTLMGCFLALDFFLFYLFFEFMLLPMYFLIGLWGGKGREYASIKFFLYTLLGSIFILIAMVALYASAIDPQTGRHTFDMVLMIDPNNFPAGSWLSPDGGAVLFGLTAREVAFLLLAFGFLIKLPAVPVHTWLPDAHVEAPTPVSVVLAGVMLKIGGYGLLRVAYPIFPEAAQTFAWLMGGLGVLAIVYGAFVALGQVNLKKLVAYSSVSHMGFVLLGIAALTDEGVNGALYQMFSHGLISPMLFLVAGALYKRTHDLRIEHYRGLTHDMPAYSGFAFVAFFASLGLPGFSGFIGELFVLLGAFASFAENGLLPRWMAVVATLGLLLGAAYSLWTLQRMFFGPSWRKDPDWRLPDIDFREKLLLFTLAALTLLFGLMPNLLFDLTDATASNFVKLILTDK